MTGHKELFEIADRLADIAAAGDGDSIRVPLSALFDAADAVGKAFSGSWLGYHSRIYYAGLEAPPPGAHFSQDWGLMERSFGSGTRGEWCEYRSEQVKEHIQMSAHDPDVPMLVALATKANETFGTAKADVESILQTELESKADNYLEDLKDQLRKVDPLTANAAANAFMPNGKFMTHDTIAAGQGVQIPPHIAVMAKAAAIQSSFDACKSAGEIARKAASHLERRSKRHVAQARSGAGANVFIGHGRAAAWRDLKDFVQERLKLPWDEFNRIPVAGVTNITRLSEMLDAAAVAFLVMTAEDERADGSMQARMNVIHEAGLFQGRLGFTRAIVLLEEGCEEFSNISGLGQIRFPQGNIAAAFEEIRRVLEREGLIQ